MKRAPNRSELADVDIENEKEIPVTMDFADSSSEEDQNEKIQTEKKDTISERVHQHKEIIFIIAVICLTFN